MLPLLAFVAQTVPSGEAKLELAVRGANLEVFTYKPKSYDGKRMILVFHGTLRDADAYRNDSERMAERFGALIVAPRFDEARFPNRKYHRGGILNEDGNRRPGSGLDVRVRARDRGRESGGGRASRRMP